MTKELGRYLTLALVAPSLAGCSSDYPCTFINVGHKTIHVRVFDAASAASQSFDIAPGCGAFVEWYGNIPSAELSSGAGPKAAIHIGEASSDHRIRQDLVFPVDETGKIYPIRAADKPAG